MIEKVFPIQGHNITSMVIDENALKISGRAVSSFEEFQAKFEKKFTLASEVKIKYDAIKSVRKEDNTPDVLIKYKTFAGITTDCEFKFTEPSDCEIFFNYLVKDLYFQRVHETQKPFRAIRNYLLGLLATIGFTVFLYYQAIAIENGTAHEAHNGKELIFNYLVGLLGKYGVIAIGVALAAYLVYHIWTRLNNPPNQTRLIPPNGF